MQSSPHGSADVPGPRLASETTGVHDIATAHVRTAGSWYAQLLWPISSQGRPPARHVAFCSQTCMFQAHTDAAWVLTGVLHARAGAAAALPRGRAGTVSCPGAGLQLRPAGAAAGGWRHGSRPPQGAPCLCAELEQPPYLWSCEGICLWMTRSADQGSPPAHTDRL